MATPVEPAGVDEDQRLAGRRALQGRPARLRRLRALLRALRPGVPPRRRADRRHHAAERAPEPQPERLSGHGPARRRGGAAGRRRRPRASQRAGLHTKILGYDHNWSLHPNDVGPPDDPANPEYAASLLANAGRAPLPRRHRVPLLLGRSRAPVGRCTTPSRRRTSTSPSARARCRATRRRRSPTPCTGTRASSPSARSATGPRRSSRGTSRSIPPAGRTTAAAARASAS